MSEDARSAYDALRRKHRAFVTAYCTCWNAAAAARAAGYVVRRANVTGYDLLQRPDIRAAVEERCKQLGLDAVSNTLTQMMQAQMSDYMRLGEDGQPHLDFEKLARDDVSVLSEVMVESRGAGTSLTAGSVNPSKIVKLRFQLSDKIRTRKQPPEAPAGKNGGAAAVEVDDHWRAKALAALIAKTEASQD